jgi:hypothetical protein
MAGDVKSVRFWTSLCALYRVLEFPWKLNLATITTPGKASVELGLDKVDLDSSILKSLKHLGLKKMKDRFIRQLFVPFPIGKSSPLTSESLLISTSTDVITFGALLLNTKFRRLLTYMSYYSSGTFLHKPFFQALASAFLAARETRLLTIPKENIDHYSRHDSEVKDAYIGKLAFKLEPAGKVRVFAMVDCWTQ